MANQPKYKAWTKNSIPHTWAGIKRVSPARLVVSPASNGVLKLIHNLKRRCNGFNKNNGNQK